MKEQKVRIKVTGLYGGKQFLNLIYSSRGQGSTKNVMSEEEEEEEKEEEEEEEEKKKKRRRKEDVLKFVTQGFCC